MAEDKKALPRVNIRFLFAMCNDIPAMRKFYSDLLGMQEVSYMNDEGFGWLCYQCEGFQFMFFRTHGRIPLIENWTWQPGYEGGGFDALSWAVEIPETEFADYYRRLKDAGVKAFSEKPEWRQGSYWGYSVMDPMGNTVEVYTSPKVKPDSDEWKG
ncbi:MAG: VOC family protein [bacterium]|nr:VOC family protein [bacterium]